MAADTPDLSRLAAYVRNRLEAEGTARIVLNKRTVYIIKADRLGDTLPGLLVASDLGESVMVRPDMPLNSGIFVSGRFSLQRAATLSKLFLAMRGTNRLIKDHT